MERQDKAAPYLFDENSLPVRADVVAAVSSGRYKHTGDRLLDNEKLALRMVELLTCGWGVKRIAREMSVSPHSVRAARNALVQRGELAPYKERVLAAFEDIVESGAIRLRDAMEEGLIPANQIAFNLGIIFDKRALAMGEPTSIGAAVQVAKEELSVEKLNSFFDRMKRATDSQSTVLPAVSEQITTLSTSDARSAAADLVPADPSKP